jgi:two-component system, NtrC family, sensor kinase
MARQFGLRTEIIVNLLILMGAALLFSGFLLLNLAEREMVRGRIEGARQQLEVAGRLLGELLPDAGSLAQQQRALRASLAYSEASWLLVDDQQQILARDSSSATRLHAEEVVSARLERQAIIHLNYTSVYSFTGSGDDFLRITVPLYTGQHFRGALQARFPLASVKDELRRVGRLYLLYVLFYGGVLLAFGVWLLGKAVLRPVRKLTSATARVAQGDLLQEVTPEGPREIAELSRSFNAMTQALQQSRHQTEESIRMLRSANEELLRTQHELLRAERLASVGHLAAGMAHEIGNPLGAVIGYLDLLHSELPPGRQQEVTDRAVGEARRIDRLVKELLDFAAPASQLSEAVDPVAVLGEAVELLHHQGALAGVRVENALPAALPPVRISRDRLLQVLINLLCNARDAVAPDPATEGMLLLRGGADRQQVWLAITDNGSGMPAEALASIFDPFFTTKAPGQGRGLGLTVCHRIVTEAGGAITAESTAGQGSTFTIRLPICFSAGEHLTPPGPSLSPGQIGM